MEDARTRIAEYRHACQKLDAELQVQYGTIGRELYENGRVSSTDQELQDTLSLLQQKSSAVSQILVQKESIEKARSASETAKEEISNIEQRLAAVEFEKNSLYSRIGVITYEEYAAGEIGEEFSLLFTSITHQNAELSRLQKELKENELRYVAASFFEKMSLKMKRNKLKSELETMEQAREDLFRSAGKQISNSELIEHVRSRNARVISDDFKRLDQERDRMYALLEARKFDYNRNQDLLNQSGVETDVAKKIKELERLVSSAQESLQEGYAQLGSLLYGREKALPDDESINAAADEIAQLLSRRAELESKISRLEAKVKIKELESQIDVDYQKEQRIRSQLAVLTEQLEELDARITSQRSQIAALKQLLQQEEPEGPSR